jgi:hypothetical protein
MRLVSAILPTRGRKEFAAQALACFLAQDYPAKELLILDDADMPSFGADAAFPEGVTYFRSFSRKTIAEKRNELCGMARGGIISHFDSDDYSVTTRISDQVKTLEDAGAMLTGYSEMLWWDGESAWHRKGDGKYILGTSLCYRRELWERSPFTDHKQGDIRYGEDNRFRSAATKSGAVVAVASGLGMMVARIHPDNTSQKRPVESGYVRIPAEQLPAGFPR